MIPDPIELLEARTEDLCREFGDAQEGVPEGSYRCPGCGAIFTYEPISCSSSPTAPVSCYDCLSPGDRAAYDAWTSGLTFEAQIAELEARISGIEAASGHEAERLRIQLASLITVRDWQAARREEA